MIAPDARALLEAAVGEGAVVEHAPVDVDGAKLSLTARPADGEALSRAVEALGRAGLAALVRGGGNRLGLGNPPRRADLLLSTAGLAGMRELDADEGVCRVGAGTTLAEARAAVNEAGWELPLDAPGAGATVGGSLAAAAAGPRALGLGLPRDVALGLDVVLGTGERTRCGGRVVKNVTGYDLGKLYVGSCGTLCVIESAWLRLRPRPEREICLEARAPAAGALCEAAIAAARRPSARAALLAVESAAADGARLVVEFAGDAPTVEGDAAWLAERAGAQERAVGALDALRRAPLAAPAAGGLRFRIAALPSQLAAHCERLRAAGARVLAEPGLGFLRAELPAGPGDAPAVAAAFDLADALARESRGGFVAEALPAAAKSGRDVYGGIAGALPLIAALEQRFDPRGVLNPGRAAGRV